MTHQCQPRTVYVREQTEKGRRWKPIGTACPECFGKQPAVAFRVGVASGPSVVHAENCRCEMCR